MGKYAENTSVSADRSRGEIEKTLQRYGATGFAYAWEDERAVIAFKLEERHIKFILTLPKVEEFRYTPSTRNWRNDSQMKAAHEQGVRQRWRALSLVIKAKLEAVDSKIVTLEDEFLAHIVMPNGQTVGEAVKPEIAKAYLNGKMPRLLLSAGGGE